MLGIVNESNATYHGNKEAISKSRLVKMSVCPAYFKYYEENPQEPTDDLIVGSAFHKYTLEPDDFENEFVVMPVFDKRTKEGKQAYQDFVDSCGDKQVINAEQFETIQSMSEAIKSNKYAKALIKGNVETSLYFVDDLTEEQCKVRPDVYRQVGDRVVITDLKSCRSALPNDFTRDVIKYGYDVQAYMYRLGASKVLNMPIENIDFVFIAVEKKAPYLVNIMQCDDYIFQRGEQMFRKYIGQYHECKETNDWYGLNGAYGIINNLTLPNYMIENIGE